MTNNEFDMQTISTKWTDQQPERVLRHRQLTDGKRKNIHYTFLRNSFNQTLINIFNFSRHYNLPFPKKKSAIFANALID